ncbi:MAG: TlpA family protein disulfide reductase [Fibrobacter sp.]|nr:TlpA family protein disulfide reductase [Fibrobacter sp.]
MATSRKKYIVIAAVIVLLGCFLVGRRDLGPHFNEIPGHVNNFTAINVDGGKTTFQEQKGKVTLITLSASWCPACMAEIPSLKKMHQELGSRGFKILMVSEDDNVKAAARFKKKQNLPWTVVHWNYDLMNTLGNPGVLPVSYLINEQDSIVQINTGIFDEDAMRRAIKKLLH